MEDCEGRANRARLGQRCKDDGENTREQKEENVNVKYTLSRNTLAQPKTTNGSCRFRVLGTRLAPYSVPCHGSSSLLLQQISILAYELVNQRGKEEVYMLEKRRLSGV